MLKTDSIVLHIDWDTDHQNPPHLWVWKEILRGVSPFVKVERFVETTSGDDEGEGE